jgi:hypothetical protein
MFEFEAQNQGINAYIEVQAEFQDSRKRDRV